MHLEHVRVHRLNRAACLVAEVQRALVGPLRLAGNATREAKSFPIGINNLEATETSIGHIRITQNLLGANLLIAFYLLPLKDASSYRYR